MVSRFLPLLLALAPAFAARCMQPAAGLALPAVRAGNAPPDECISRKKTKDREDEDENEANGKEPGQGLPRSRNVPIPYIRRDTGFDTNSNFLSPSPGVGVLVCHRCMMKRIVWITVFIGILAVIAVFSAGCLSGKTAPAGVTAGRPQYVIGVDTDYRPFTYRDGQGNITGFDIEAARWIAARKGFDPVFVDVSWDDIIPALEQGKIDMIYSGMTVTPEREGRVDFTRPYYVVNQSVAARTGSNVSMQDFHAGRLRVGAQAGSTGAAWVAENLVRAGLMPAENLVLYPGVPSLAAGLERGEVQAIIGDAPSIRLMAGEKSFTLIGGVPTGERYAIAVRKGDTRTREMMDDGLSQLMKDPSWNLFLEKYGLGAAGSGGVPVRGRPETTEELKTYVDEAASFALSHGRDAAIAAFQDPDGPFVTGDTYVYALDYSGVALALPFQPGLVGTNFLPLRDATGKPYTDIEIRLARAGGGFILYRYPEPSENGTSRLKISYVRPVDDTCWIGAGIYTDEDVLIDPELREFVNNAREYALSHARDDALAAFNDPAGPFISGDLYVFAYDYNGTVLAWPYRPDQVGKNRYNETDMMGSYHVREMIAKARQGGGMVDYYSTNPFTNRTALKVSTVVDVDGSWFLGAGRYIEPGPLRLVS
ncbi:MAG: transporter substrate-binding domain-containing protein [Methanolinea sp.]|jgi:polar amino acid transport system substrate-binding protein|nr:transporter substrate-binding domain-containing protein [Methanolinea sp.]